MKCRHCRTPLQLSLVDLGSSPPSNAYLTQTTYLKPEKWFPLRVLVCQTCWLTQTQDFADAAELFDADYAYFSGFSSSWLKHCKRYVVEVVERFGLNKESHVVEVAANDGYLLQYVQAARIPCTGIEPTASTAAAARAKKIDIVQEFFGCESADRLSRSGKQADLMIANNVLAHVPDINDFVGGFTRLLKPTGVATFEFPHLLSLLRHNQFDTIYHEHFSYLSLIAVAKIFAAAGLSVFDVQQLDTHGGSLRVFAQRDDTGPHPIDPRVTEVMSLEDDAGLQRAATYQPFQECVQRIKDDFLTFLIESKRAGKTVVAYGAAAKGNTLLNYAGVRPDLIRYVVDQNPAKQGKWMPGSRIPIVAEDQLRRTRPDYIVILPWNLTTEIATQLSYVSEWDARFVRAIPGLEIL